jgi:3-oxoacyl-[acyl-carrier protein] reductase
VFAKEGANVAFTYSSSVEAANELETELNALGIKAKGYKSNAASFQEAQDLAETVMNEFGSIDVLVNNAGITKDNLLMRISEEDFDKVIEVNLKSVFNMTKAVQRTMLKQRKGSIINMSSVVGVKGNAGQTNYAASKAGIIGFSKSVALELGSRNIRSNVIAPGFIETEMTAKLDEDTVKGWREAIPLKRGGTPEDIANACVFLASDMSAYITGQTLHVDGGMLT